MARYDNIVHVDAETFYSSKEGYTLTKMSTIEYVRDPRFNLLGIAVAWNDEPSVYMSEEEFLGWAEGVDWKKTAVSAYNASFDCSILFEHYGIKPCYYIDPQSAARMLLPIDSVALKVVAPLLGLRDKGNALVDGGKESSQALADYAVLDNDLSRQIFHILYPLLPDIEKDLIHLTIRMAAEPTLFLDRQVLDDVYEEAVRGRDEAIRLSGYAESRLSSNPQFAAIIKELGLKAPLKISQTTGEETEAFAKGDSEFVAFMLDHPDYKHVWEGRLAAKSTINQTRAKKFMKVAELGNGSWPFPLKFAGARTHRWSGVDYNPQNLPASHRSKLRTAIVAPKGYKIVVADSSGIELRTNMWVCGQKDKLDLIREGGDLYKEEAANQFGIPVSEVTKNQRQYGKVIQLACGFQMGPVRFREYCAAGPLGMDPIYLSESEAFRSIQAYRSGNPMIPKTWQEMNHWMQVMTLKGSAETRGHLTFAYESIIFPSGRTILYPDLRQSEEGSWVCGYGKQKRYIFSGLLLENIVQSTARDIVAEQMLKIDERYRVVGCCHDEVICVVPDSEADEALAFMLQVMSTPPAWAPDLPVSAEGGYAHNYSK